MKVTRPKTDQNAEFAVFVNNEPCTEYMLPATNSIDPNTVECFVPVGPGDRITVKGSFSGSVLHGAFDLVVDGSFLADSRIEGEKDGTVKLAKKRNIHLKRGLSCPKPPGWISSDSPKDLIDGDIHVAALKDDVAANLDRYEIECEDAPRPGIGSIELIISVNQQTRDLYEDPKWDITCGNWAIRNRQVVRESGIKPEYAMELRAIDQVSQKRSVKHRRHWEQTRFGSKPWARLIFYYRSQKAIDDAGCITRPLDVHELEVGYEGSFIVGYDPTPVNRKKKESQVDDDDDDAASLRTNESSATSMFTTPVPEEPKAKAKTKSKKAPEPQKTPTPKKDAPKKKGRLGGTLHIPKTAEKSLIVLEHEANGGGSGSGSSTPFMQYVKEAQRKSEDRQRKRTAEEGFFEHFMSSVQYEIAVARPNPSMTAEQSYGYDYIMDVPDVDLTGAFAEVDKMISGDETLQAIINNPPLDSDPAPEPVENNLPLGNKEWGFDTIDVASTRQVVPAAVMVSGDGVEAAHTGALQPDAHATAEVKDSHNHLPPRSELHSVSSTFNTSNFDLDLLPSTSETRTKIGPDSIDTFGLNIFAIDYGPYHDEVTALTDFNNRIAQVAVKEPSTDRFYLKQVFAARQQAETEAEARARRDSPIQPTTITNKSNSNSNSPTPSQSQSVKEEADLSDAPQPSSPQQQKTPATPAGKMSSRPTTPATGTLKRPASATPSSDSPDKKSRLFELAERKAKLHRELEEKKARKAAVLKDIEEKRKAREEAERERERKRVEEEKCRAEEARKREEAEVKEIEELERIHAEEDEEMEQLEGEREAQELDELERLNADEDEDLEALERQWAEAYRQPMGRSEGGNRRR